MDNKLPEDLLADPSRCWQFLETLASVWRLEITPVDAYNNVCAVLRPGYMASQPEFNPCYCHSLQEAYDELHRLHLEDVTISSI